MRLLLVAVAACAVGCASRTPYVVMKEKADPPLVLCPKTPRADIDSLLGPGSDAGGDKEAGFNRLQYRFTGADGSERGVVVRYEGDALNQVIPAVEWRRARDLGANPIERPGRGEDGRPLYLESKLPWLAACKFLGEHSASAELKPDAFDKLTKGSVEKGANFFVVLPTDEHAYPPFYSAALYRCGEVNPDKCVSGPLPH